MNNRHLISRTTSNQEHKASVVTRILDAKIITAWLMGQHSSMKLNKIIAGYGAIV
ncbi:hypothetical protein [Sporomusa sp.]|uniref:hypothetical protein n=1 Tax=Sporomusa sp. TaxID=2078658 RepID=UPI002C3C9501|nr:hypothetical protein [Sporomusa sp.]HWR44849.1 hypothetical protein [Sporomusa sp.]